MVLSNGFNSLLGNNYFMFFIGRFGMLLVLYAATLKKICQLMSNFIMHLPIIPCI